MFRSSLKGFFTGKSKENKNFNNTFIGSSNSTKETGEYSSLVTNNEEAFSGNPLRALKHSKKNAFSNYGSSDLLEARGIEELIQDFSKSANNFKISMKNIDLAEKIKQNHKKDKMQD